MRTEVALEGFLNACRARGLRPRTVAWYEVLLRRFDHAYPELPQEPGAIERFLGDLQGSDETRHAYYSVLRVFYRWASRRRLCRNQISHLSPPRRRKKKPRTLALADLGCLLAAPLSKRDRALITLLIDSGIRIGEAVGMDREDTEDETIIVQGKTGQREVPISEETRRLLLDLVDHGPLFVGRKGRLTNSGARQAVRAAMGKAGITGQKLGPHTLRHTFGRQYIVAGGDLVSLQRILGHSQIQTTRIYAELDLRDVMSQHRRFTPLKSANMARQGRFFE